MAHQLYVLQTGCLALLEQRMNSKMDPQDLESHEKIKVATPTNEINPLGKGTRTNDVFFLGTTTYRFRDRNQW